MTQKHTPTPWKIEKLHGDTQIVGTEGSLICIDTGYYPVAPSEEDMNHIVKCVNMHDELVKALDTLLKLNEDNGPFGGELYQDRIDRAWEKSRSALAKARGET